MPSNDNNETNGEKAVVKVIPVPMSHLLVCVDRSNVSLWSDWTTPGNEKLLWEVSLKDLLRSDITSISPIHSNYDFIVIPLDSCLIQMELGSDKAVLLVLSKFGRSLWLHTLEIATHGYSEGSVDKALVVNVIHRLLLSESIDDMPTLQPKIDSLPQSWRIFVTWLSVGTLRCVQIDILNQKVITLRDIQSLSDQQEKEKMDIIRCRSVLDTGITSADIWCTISIKSADGVCIIKKGDRYI